MAAASSAIPLGLLHMGPLQFWLKARVLSHAWRLGRFYIKVNHRCIKAVAPWTTSRLFQSGVRLGLTSKSKVVTTDASNSVWGALLEGNPAPDQFFLALPAAICGHHVRVCSDNPTEVAYINRQGGLRSHSLYRLAQRLLFWVQNELLSLKAVHMPGSLNHGADMLSRGNVALGEWTLHPHTVQEILSVLGKAEVDLFALLPRVIKQVRETK